VIAPVLAAYAAQAWVKVVAVLALVAALFGAGWHYGAHFARTECEGARAVERSQWEQERARLAMAYAAAESAARAEEKRRAEESTRIVGELERAQAATAVRAVRAERAADGLRDTIAALNARPLPDAPSCPAAAGYAREATVARELLGACAEEYRGVAAEADRLRDQVTGLQGWVDAIEK
jgi:hypothetical protein